MNLFETIQILEQLDDNLVIFARKNGEWNLNSSVALVLNSDVDQIGSNLEGLHYFLEVDVAQEVLSVWKAWRNGRIPNDAERLEAVLYYVENDAYIA